MRSEPALPVGKGRIFVGIPVDNDTQQHINALLRPITGLPCDIRWVPENNRHLTLAFLGRLKHPEVEILVGLFDQTYRQEPRFHFRFTELERFPGPAGRILALCNKPDGPMDRLFQMTSRLLQENGIDRDRKTFRPHITVGKIRNAKQVDSSLYRKTDIYLDVSKITLYLSTDSGNGPVYTALKQTPLKC